MPHTTVTFYFFFLRCPSNPVLSLVADGTPFSISTFHGQPDIISYELIKYLIVVVFSRGLILDKMPVVLLCTGLPSVVIATAWFGCLRNSLGRNDRLQYGLEWNKVSRRSTVRNGTALLHVASRLKRSVPR